MHLEKNRTYACTFPVQRKEIDVVKVRFTMRYSSRKLSNDKVITTACIFWRPIACSFQVMSGNILFLGNKIFEIPPFFQTRPGDLGKKVHACSIRFSTLNVQGILRNLKVPIWRSWGEMWRRNINATKQGKQTWLISHAGRDIFGSFWRFFLRFFDLKRKYAW